MSHSFRIRKGLDIRLQGEASKSFGPAPKISAFAIKPPDFHGLIPKLAVKPGDQVKAGTILFYDKNDDRIKFASPVSGEVVDIVRGEKRRILEVKIIPDQSNSFEDFGAMNLSSASREDLLQRILTMGLWPLFQQRPFAVLANPSDKPRSIFISGFDSAPLAPDPDFVMTGLENDFEQGVKALIKLADGGSVHLNTRAGSTFFKSIEGVTINQFEGPHPAGNVGVQIHQVAPLNKGEVVWVINPQDVANLGRSLTKGQVDLQRTVAVTGPKAANPQYFKVRPGAAVQSLLIGGTDSTDRVVSGNALVGKSVGTEGFLGYYDHQITLLEEGHEPQFFLTEGWFAPGFGKFSASRSFPTWLMPKSKKWNLKTSLNGEGRAFVMTGQYEKVFPFNIYPVQLIKSIMVNDIDMMEKLGIYEVAPEDFALCEYVCTSKIEVQEVIREGLDTVKRECT
jgi:Na+-transporting NADH:ubiquinone oxidoreductase subunit A